MPCEEHPPWFPPTVCRSSYNIKVIRELSSVTKSPRKVPSTSSPSTHPSKFSSYRLLRTVSNHYCYNLSRPSNKLRNIALATLGSIQQASPSKKSPPSHTLGRFFNSIPNGVKKRNASSSIPDHNAIKRLRCGERDEDDDIVVISEPREKGKMLQKSKSKEEDTWNNADILKLFRLDPQKLG